MRSALAVEWLKLRHSRVVQVATMAVLLLPTTLGAAFVAAAGRAGADPLSLKAGALVTDEGWAGYLGVVHQIFGTGGLLGMGVVVAWCFGREFADGTAVSLYASATPRERVAAAKHLVLGAWMVAVAVLLGPAAVAVGMAAGLGLPDAEARAGLTRLLVLAVLTGLLALGVSFFASAGRGYLAGFGGLLGLIVVAQLAVVLGAGGWVPWSLPGLWAVATPGSGLEQVPATRLVVVPLCALALAALTIGWWRRAELH